MSLPLTNTRFTTSLSAKISDTATSLTLDKSTDAEGTTFSGTYELTFDEGTSKEEDMIVTLAGAAGTIGTRGLSKVDGKTLVTANRFSHDRGAVVKMTNAILPRIVNLLNGSETFDNKLSYTSVPTLSADVDIATKKYADDLAIAGAPDASATVKGLMEKGSAAEAASGAADGSGDTSAPLAVTTSICSNTSSAAQLIPVTDADGDIPVEFMELDATWTFSGILDVATATLWKLGGVAFTGTMALLNEATTFFGATDITGAEAETLTDGSDASALHDHKKTSILTTRVLSTASAAVTYAHGLGVTPRWVTITCSGSNAAASRSYHSFGNYDGTSSQVIYTINENGTPASGNSTSYSVIAGTATGTSQTGVVTVDATNVTITWTKNGSPDGTADLIIECQA